MKLGDVFGRLTAVRFVGRDGNHNAIWLFRCACGAERSIRIDPVRRGLTRSCGCFQRERAAEKCIADNTKHSMYGTPEYIVWSGMLARCRNPENPKYHRYGGRGISVCKEWENDFIAFYLAMGERPSAGHTLDRIDTNGNYEPGNCRWATWQQQQRNRSNNHVVVFHGREMCLAEAISLSAVSKSTVYKRLREGWTAMRALTEPVR